MKSFLITAAIFLGVCMGYFFLMLSGTENYFTYILDDAYIHLAMAKNFALHRVWGITEYSFSSSSSSPVFTFILSILIFFLGNHELIPLIFNVVCAVFMLFFLNKYYAYYFSQSKTVVIAGLFTLIFTSVPLLIFSGMEHVLQIMMVTVNILYFEKWRQSGYKNRYDSACVYFTLALLGLIRFESMFYFTALSFVLLLLRRYKEMAGVIVFGFVPVLIFSYFTYQETGYFFPNSVIIKGLRFDLSKDYIEQLVNIFLFKFVENPYFYNASLCPLLISVFFIIKDAKKKLGFQEVLARNFFLVVWCVALCIHGTFSQFTNFYRYEAYLLTGFAMAIVPKLKIYFKERQFLVKKNRTIAALIVFSMGALILKIGLVSFLIVTGSKNIYEQQIQSARFLKKYYNQSKVMANDIGAVSYFTDIHLFDFVGLGSKEIVPLRMKKRKVDAEVECFLTKYSAENNYTLAVAYDEWMDGHTPKNWRKAAVLTISGRNAVLGRDHVYIYSIDPAIHDALKAHVRSFTWNKGIKVEVLD
ncbi:hypothetical protein DRF65_00075 [Chryseobacterium pennae]|uniref:Glycosyltransferase RgtA/B/C/D-like domain-containing protein n=1 Tax=Chryseobacterium pennae TaxID=2258962 RepID=A0A3D9CET2_9FLAO|nr:hypothetical protein [Chryseobacterium pennae]REC64021.1 hypothetical protein DRF65_00075 [Chryseobacterium pennae]